MSTDTAVAHLTADRWARATRHLVAKAISEFTHERLLTPVRRRDGDYLLRGDDPSTRYVFTARHFTLDHWLVDPDSIVRTRDGAPAPLDALAFCIDLRDTLGLSEQVLPLYLEEITSTLASAAYKDFRQRQLDAKSLARADYQTIEHDMTEGHPCFVANNGRLGFDAAEYLRYAPEAADPLRLVWVAAHRDHSTFTSAADLDYDSLLGQELDSATLDRFARSMKDLGLDLADYHLIPAHPWQWRSRLSVTFANDVARQRIVYLGHGDDDYLPQQSIRTFFNVSQPHRHYVKTALSVLNMGFVRGLSAAYMKDTPAINDWLHGLVVGDPTLRRLGFTVLRERAAIGYRQEQYDVAAQRGSSYHKMLAALWRESPVGHGDRLMTMAALLHLDRDGRSVAAALIEESGLTATEWLWRYLDAYLAPLLHCFYAYGLVFMPHGENVILVIEDGVPQRALMKDIAEEIGVLDAHVPLPPGVDRIRIEVPEELWSLSIFTDVFDCFLRFLNAILASAGVLSEHDFWSTVADCVVDYQRSTPEFADRFARYDLFASTFTLSCLNRLQLRNNQQMLDLQDPDAAGSLQLAGVLENPIAPFRNCDASGAPVTQ